MQIANRKISYREAREAGLTSADAGILRGKLQFAVSALLWKAGRMSMVATSDRQYDKSGRNDLTPPIIGSLKWMECLLEALPNEVAYLKLSDRIVLAVFTGASSEQTRDGRVCQHAQRRTFPPPLNLSQSLQKIYFSELLW